MKKTHKRSRFYSKVFGWVVRPVCKVDNVTFCYTASTNWAEVDCQKCLRKR